jgi:hypothetical protein
MIMPAALADETGMTNNDSAVSTANRFIGASQEVHSQAATGPLSRNSTAALLIMM